MPKYSVSIPMLTYEAFFIEASSPEEAMKQLRKDDLTNVSSQEAVDYCEELDPDRAEWVCYDEAGKEVLTWPARELNRRKA